MTESNTFYYMLDIFLYVNTCPSEFGLFLQAQAGKLSLRDMNYFSKGSAAIPSLDSQPGLADHTARASAKFSVI